MPQPVLDHNEHGTAQAQLFVLRLWREDLGEGCHEWRGKVQHLTNGDARYFRDWSALIACLQDMLSDKPHQL